MLNCETQAPEIEEEIKYQAIGNLGDVHQSLNTFFEHGQWFVECNKCGGQWSVNDCEDSRGNESFSFELVTECDEFCLSYS